MSRTKRGFFVRILSEIQETLEKCEDYIRKGKLAPARALLLALPLKKIPQEKRLPLARMARRAGPLFLGFRLLHGMLGRVGKRNPQHAEILAEYAVMLIQNGNNREALSLLEKIDLGLHPDLLLAKAWAHFERWEYYAALPLLQEYVARKKDPYLNLAGRINLAEAFNEEEKFGPALKILHNAISEAEKCGHTRLLANGLHLRARAYFGMRELEKSDRDLDWALRIYGKRDASDAALIRRQRAINQAHKERSVKPLLAFRKEAAAREEWESVRECDFQILALRFERALYKRLYLGTPYPSFRDRLEKRFGAFPLPNSILWGPPNAPTLDLSKSSFVFRGKKLKPTRQTRALLSTLVSDSYRPLSVGGIFAALFPGESFDLDLSPVRVHQCIKRLRQWLRQNKISLELRCESQRYFLKRSAPFALRSPLHEQSAEALLRPLVHLESGFAPGQSFSASEARAFLGLSKATVTRYLSSALTSGALEKQGRGKNTNYRFVGARRR